MIKKLEDAGLGYFVQAESTHHRFGKKMFSSVYKSMYPYFSTGSIPLRHLVYRVLDLPPSMQPLLYDFGQVVGKTENDYVTQIVTNHMQKVAMFLTVLK